MSPDGRGPSTEQNGSELAPDYMIWKNYVEQSKEHDKDLVDRRNKNLDTMLLFAGLFSAILTAFLIESTNMMEEDLAETSAKLLLLLAQSQWRIETGNQVNSLPPVEAPDFSPTTEARWINGLWFMALALALGAAMIAMLAKEWLAEFIASAPAHPLENARERQSRLETLINWHTLRIIDFLPTLLHSSLVLFMLGLIIRLWLLDRIIAWFIAAVSATLLAFYTIMVILGAIHEKSPYRARVSIHLANFFALIRGLLAFRCVKKRKKRSEKSSEEKKPHLDEVATEDLRALIWLITQAMDRNIIGGAFQVLVTLVTRLIELRAQEKTHKQPFGAMDIIMYPFEHTSALFRGFIENSRGTPRTNHQGALFSTSSVLDDQQTIIGVGLELAGHITKMPIDYGRELTLCKGTNVVGYVSALIKVYHYVWRPHTQDRDQTKEVFYEDQDEQEMIERLEESSFEALDAVWNNYQTPFYADGYAELTTAELTLTRLVSRKSSTQVSQTSSSQDQDSGVSHYIDIQKPSTFMDPKSVPSLRARYSRALCRASLLLATHQERHAMIGTTALIHLLEAINDGATADSLNSSSYMATHHPQNGNNNSTAITVFKPSDNRYYTLRSNDIGHKCGLLAVLTDLLGDNSVKSASEVETVAIRAIESVTPKLIKQWIAIQESNPNERLGPVSKEDNDTTTFANCASNWEKFENHKPNSFGPRPYAETALSHLLQVAHFAVSFLGVDGICQLPEIALKVLCDRISTGPTTEARKEEYEYVVGGTQLFQIWVSSLGRTGAQSRDANCWSEDAKVQVLRLLAVHDEKESIFSRVLRDAESTTEQIVPAQELFLIVLDNMVTVTCHPAVIESLFNTVLSTQQISNWIKLEDIFRFLDVVSLFIVHCAPQLERRSGDYLDAIDKVIKSLLGDVSHLPDETLLRLSNRMRNPSSQTSQAYFKNSKDMILNEQNRRREAQQVASGSRQGVVGSSREQSSDVEDGRSPSHYAKDTDPLTRRGLPM